MAQAMAPDEFARNLQNVVQAYGALMEGSTQIIDDETKLPLPKEGMKLALFAAIKLTPRGEQREMLKTGYVMLGQFQPLTDEQREALSSWASSTNIPNFGSLPKRIQQSVFEEIASVGGTVTELGAKVSAETNALLADLRRAGV